MKQFQDLMEFLISMLQNDGKKLALWRVLFFLLMSHHFQTGIPHGVLTPIDELFGYEQFTFLRMSP